VALRDRCGCGFLVTLVVPPPKWLGAAEDLRHVLVIVRGRLHWLWGGLAPCPTENRKVALVNCSCYWVTSLVGRFLRCPILWTRFVQHLLTVEPPCVGQHNGDVACWQAREPQEKIGVSLVSWISPSDWMVFILWLVHSMTRWYNHLAHSFTFPQTSYTRLFSVARIKSLLCSLSSSSRAL
jgi:hypothetical protein